VCKGKVLRKSVNKLIDAADKLLLGKVIVEFAIVAQVGKPFCIATYSIESDDPMSLTSYIIFEKIDEFCTGVLRLNDDVHKKCERAAELVSKLRAPLKDELHEYRSLKVMKIAEMERIEGETPLDELQQRQRELGWIENKLKETERKLNELDQKLGPKTRADFKQYSKNIAAKAFNKMLKVYNDDGSLYRSKKVLKAVKLFNLMYLKSEPPITVLEDMVNKLRNFRIDDFDDQEFLN